MSHMYVKIFDPLKYLKRKAVLRERGSLIFLVPRLGFNERETIYRKEA